MKRLRDRQLQRSRVVLVLTAIVLGGLATLGLLLTTDTIDRMGDWIDADDAVVNDAAYRSLLDNDLVWQAATAALALVLIACGLALLALQIPPRRSQQDHRVVAQPGEIAGADIVRGDALATALEDDIGSDERVDSVRAEVRPDDGLIRLRVTAMDDVPLRELQERVILPAVRRAAQVAEMDSEPHVETDVRFAPRRSRQLA
jgi:hypothetical protein